MSAAHEGGPARWLHTRPALTHKRKGYLRCTLRRYWPKGSRLAKRVCRKVLNPAALLHELGQRGVGFRSLGDSIDTTTPAGRLMLQMLAAIAEFERGIIRERCASGIARAKAEGRQLGRKPALNPHQRQRARELLQAGETQRAVARLLGVGQATIGRLAP